LRRKASALERPVTACVPIRAAAALAKAGFGSTCHQSHPVILADQLMDASTPP
jgi:hypothetical protein